MCKLHTFGLIELQRIVQQFPYKPVIESLLLGLLHPLPNDFLVNLLVDFQPFVTLELLERDQVQ